MKAKELMSFKNWVVVGDVLNKDKYAYKILNSIKTAQYNVAGVNPKGGEGIFSSLKDVPFNIEVVDLCINSIKGLEILKEAKELNINNVLVQPGAGSIEIFKYGEENNMNIIDGCALVELKNLGK